MSLDKRHSVSFELTEEEKSRVFIGQMVHLGEAAPWKLEIPHDLSLEEFGKALHAARTLARKSAFWWGQIYAVAREVYGEEVYQLLDAWDYSESTLQNYRRLTTQIDPSLWNEPIADRHFFAIGGQVQDAEEQREWVEYAKSSGISGDALRKEIRENHEARGLRSRPETADWVQCDRCHGEGGWPESKEREPS